MPKTKLPSLLPPTGGRNDFFLNPELRARYAAYRGLSCIPTIFARTNYRAAILFARAKLLGPSWEDGIDHAHNWGKEVIDTLGINVQVHGEPPKERALLIANHRSYVDIPLMLSLVRCTFLAKKEVRSYPTIGPVADYISCVFVDRKDKESRTASRKAISDTLDKGLSILVYPEGTSYPGPDLLPFRKGAFELAADGLFPVCPIAIEYQDRDSCWNGDSESLRRFGIRRQSARISVAVRFGPPMLSSDGEKLWQASERWIKDHCIPPE